MDPSEIDVLVQRLIANPHDQEALAYAHHAGTNDPKSYAMLLEKVGAATVDPGYASHWLSEAANVWSSALGDAHRAARVLMLAVDKDPTQETAAERLAQLYREKGEHRALVALLERRAKALAPLTSQSPQMRVQLAAMHEELGRLWSEPPLSVPKKAVENYRRSIELDASSAYAIYAARELHKQAQQWAEAVPLFELEQAIVDDPQRKLALYRDEAEVRKLTGDRAGATEAIRQARALDKDDPALAQELGASILERMQAGEPVSAFEREEAAELFVTLAETYDGEHGYAYATAALEAKPGHDRGMQLAAHYAASLGRTAEVKSFWAHYLKANPEGPLAEDARRETAGFDLSALSAPRVAARAPAHAAENGVHKDREASHAGAPPTAGSYSGAPPTNASEVPALLEAAEALVNRGRKPEAFAKYKEALAIDATNSEALSWVEDYLRQKRQYADLRDVLMRAVRAPQASAETKKQQLLEVAGLCETQLRDLETAIQAYKQICALDRSDASARDHLRRLLERGARWDDLASVLEQEAMGASDTETKIGLEKKLAQLHEVKRKDLVAAGEAWARMAALLPGDESVIGSAVKLFEKAQRRDLAAQVIAENVEPIEDKQAKAALYARLGDLREKGGDAGGAGEAFTEAAELEQNAKMWEAAERCLTAAERWGQAAHAVASRAELSTEPKAKAALLLRSSTLSAKAGDASAALLSLEQASDLDPENDGYATGVESRYEADDRFRDWAEFLLKRAEKLDNKGKRLELRKRAAALQTERLEDAEAARETLLKALEDGNDVDVIMQLTDDAERRGEFGEARDLLQRLLGLSDNPADKARIALREAKIMAEGLDDVVGAIERYEWVLAKVDPKSREALQQIAALHEIRGDDAGVAAALERELAILTDDAEKLVTAQRLASLYEGPLDDTKGAMAALEIVHRLDAEDFDATARLEDLCEKTGNWARVAELLTSLIEVEGDDDELSGMTRKLADVLASKLDRGDDALAVLLVPAEAGDKPCRDAYVELGDKLGWKGVVATKLIEWHGESPGSAERNEALRGAFERFLSVGRDGEAARVAVELARSKGADHDLAQQLEEIALKLKDLEGLSVAHDLLSKELSGVERAEELVRQAEVLVKAGVDPVEAQQHGEAGLTSVPPAEVEPLLSRLAALTEAPGTVIDVYERQIGRCRAPADRLAALARAAQVAALRGAADRARTFFELALAPGAQEDTLVTLELAAARGDQEHGGTTLRETLAEALSMGGQGARDGGRTRSALLRRAATIAHRELDDVDKAFTWLGDALIALVDSASLDALEELAEQVSDVKRAEETIGRALTEVFDGPLVRQLLSRRVRLRRERLDDAVGAAQDLKKLHDLSPGDTAIMEELSGLLTDLGDFRGMVQVLEDQILRGKDPQARAELARKVAKLWEEQLDDPREAADAWRRVLRMKQGDTEAQAGLERAKANMLKKREEGAAIAAAAPAAEEAEEAVAAITPAQVETAGSTPLAASQSEASASEVEALTAVEKDAGAGAAAESDVASEESVESSESAAAASAEAESVAVDESADSPEEGYREELLSVDDAELIDEDIDEDEVEEGKEEDEEAP